MSGQFLTEISNATKTQKFKAMLGELVGFKTLPNNQEAMIVKRIVDQAPNGGFIMGDTIIVTMGKAPNEELSIKRNTIETFRNPSSKNFSNPGAIFSFTDVVISKDGKSAEVKFIRELHSGGKDDVRSLMVGMVRPLPIAQSSSSGTASVEVIDTNRRVVVDNENAFVEAILQCWKASVSLMIGNGLQETAKNAFVISDYHDSKPISIIIKNIPEEQNGNPVYRNDKAVYRTPKPSELKQQLLDNKTISLIREKLRASPGKEKLNIVPALRILVPAGNACQDAYTNTIKDFTGKFRINMGDDGASEREVIGYKKAVISLWNGMVSSVKALEYQRPRLTDQEGSESIKKGGALNKESSTKNRNNAEAVAQSVSTMFDDNNLPQSVGAQNYEQGAGAVTENKSSQHQIPSINEGYSLTTQQEMPGPPTAYDYESAPDEGEPFDLSAFEEEYLEHSQLQREDGNTVTHYASEQQMMDEMFPEDRIRSLSQSPS